ncbi:MAG: C40 family peptidase [Spirochaetes bacterium]|nr:C40 family peptidase [Spirochaetota bacterium]
MRSFLRIFIPVFMAGIFSAGFSDGLADELDNTLKDDFSKQETVKIRFEVNKRIYSFEAGKFKLQKIKQNREKIRAITEKIVPWAIMEGMVPPEVARVIVYMYHATEAGVSFTDAEDLIPLVAQQDIPMMDFVLMVQYNKEAKEAGIPEEIKDAFLGYSFSKGWDGVSILTGGRGLVLAKASGMNINKTASLLLKKLPAKGADVSSDRLISIVVGVIGKSIMRKNSEQIIKNIEESHYTVVNSENSPAGIKSIINEASGAGKSIRSVNRTQVKDTPLKNDTIDREQGIIYEPEESSAKSNWQVLDRNMYYAAIKPWIGTPYRFGNKTGRPGIDCSGFTRNVLVSKKVGVPSGVIGHGTASQRKAGKAVNRAGLRAGDIVFFSASPGKNKITHVGLVTSPGYFVHASSRGVINDRLNRKWWKTRYVTGRRIFVKVVK